MYNSITTFVIYTSPRDNRQKIWLLCMFCIVILTLLNPKYFQTPAQVQVHRFNFCLIDILIIATSATSFPRIDFLFKLETWKRTIFCLWIIFFPNWMDGVVGKLQQVQHSHPHAHTQHLIWKVFLELEDIHHHHNYHCFVSSGIFPKLFLES